MEDLQGQAEWLNRIKINQLNNKALTIASKLARMIRFSNGNIVKLQDEQIAMRIAEQVLDIDQPELHALFREFLEEALKANDTDPLSVKLKYIRRKSQGLYRGSKVE